MAYPAIASNMITRSVEHLRSILRAHSREANKEEVFAESRYILCHLEQYVVEWEQTSNILDEEQGREVEHELKEETETELPLPASAENHVLNERLRRAETLHQSKDLLCLRDVFINTELSR